jgi:hypothetical protein
LWFGTAITCDLRIALRGACIKLTRTADLLMRVLDHFLPLCNPANCAGYGKQHGEHRGRETECLEGDTRIEIDIRVQFLFDEIFIG